MDRIRITELSELREQNRCGIVNPSKAFRMLSRIVLDVTYKCSLACPNCNRLCGTFARGHDIPLQEIQQFVDDSIQMQKKWEHIYIAGGEPALHRDIEHIFEAIDHYSTFYRQTFKTKLLVKYFTNNHSPRARQVLESLPEDYIVVNSNKSDSNRRFKPVLVAPVDVGYYDDANLTPCQELYQCGMALNYRGYYPCAIAAAIDDVLLGGKLAIRCLADVTFEALAEILHQTCRYCGHYFEPLGYRREAQLMISPTWERFLDDHQQKTMERP